MTANPKSIDWLKARQPVERVLDGGPTRCNPLDEEFLAGRRLSPEEMYRLTAADWVATDTALYYLRFNAEQAERWLWNDVQGAELVRRRWVFAKVRIRVSGGEWVLSLGRRGAASLLSIVAKQTRSDADASERQELGGE